MRGERGKVEQKYTDVQFFFTNICKCGIFFVSLWRFLIVTYEKIKNFR